MKVTKYPATLKQGLKDLYIGDTSGGVTNAGIYSYHNLLAIWTTLTSSKTLNKLSLKIPLACYLTRIPT